MPKYLSRVVMQEVYELVIEAEDEETADQIASDTDLDEYAEIGGQTVDATIEEITEWLAELYAHVASLP